MTTAQRLRDEGKAAGIVAGELKGRRHMLAALLILKFGKRFTPALVAKVEQANSEELESLATRVLSAESVDEVFLK